MMIVEAVIIIHLYVLTDDDECGSSHNICHLHAMCNNTEGSYKCTCLEGFVGDGVTCERKSYCENVKLI